MNRNFVAEHVLIRDGFTLTLRVDEVTGDFRVKCSPPPHEITLPQIRTDMKKWPKVVAYGWARRVNGGRPDPSLVHVELSPFRNGVCRGQFSFNGNATPNGAA